MKLSVDKTTYLARAALVKMREEGLAEVPNFAVALRIGRSLIEQWGERGDAVDAFVRRKIASLSRRVVEGTPEWEVLYRRYREEEMRKRRRPPSSR